MNMYGVIGTSNPEYLLADPQGADRFSVPCKPGQGKLLRGTIVYRGTNGLYLPATQIEVGGSHFVAVLDESIDTDGETVAVNAAAFREGRFVKGRVILQNGDPLTDLNVKVLRSMGIMLDPMESDEAFDNGGHTVTYVANNGVTPAEDDVVKTVAAGAAHIVLSNSDTGFTAPESKAFSKWNTKDDGTGGNISAGTSMELEENVTLYAVWADE